LTYVKEKIIASNYSLEVAHAFSTIHPMHVKLACSRGMARLINLVRQCQISFYISIPAYSTSTDTFHIGYRILIRFFIKAQCLVCTSCWNLYHILKPAALSYSFCMTKVMIRAADGKALRLNLDNFQSLVVCFIRLKKVARLFELV
jgi:hypothetical protein